MVPVDDGEAPPEHLERALHRYPIVGIEIRIIGVPVVREMHVAERLVFMQQDRAAYEANGMIEPQHL
jgi:hypothetical protein